MTSALLLILFVLLASVAYAGAQGAPWVPTPKHHLTRFRHLASLQKTDVFYDLGCGDGRLLLEAANKGAEAHGFELSLPLLIAAYIRRGLQPKPVRKRIHIHYKNARKANLKDATVVFIFLTRHVLEDIQQKLKTELKPGTRVLSYTWPIQGWTPTTTDTQPSEATIYLYTHKA